MIESGEIAAGAPLDYEAFARTHPNEQLAALRSGLDWAGDRYLESPEHSYRVATAVRRVRDRGLPGRRSRQVRSGDRIRIEGWHSATPCLRFVGRGSDLVDLVGEKLHERFVRGVLDRLFEQDDDFAVLVPEPLESGPAWYICVTTRAPGGPAATGARLVRRRDGRPGHEVG